MPFYTNAYKGRANRQESATHLSDEFDRIAAAFVALQDSNTVFIDIYDHLGGTNYEVIDPANGQLQQITITQDTLISVREPAAGSDATSHRITLMVHGGGYRIINGWGPQTWKEEGLVDWLWIYTGLGEKASAVLEFCFDGKAWLCVAFSRNENFGSDAVPGTTQETFPLISGLVSESGLSTLTWHRASYGFGADEDGSEILLPQDQARFTGARYVRNWIATPKDLKSVAWKPDGCTVGTEAGGGQDGGDVDKITFDITHGELQHWMLLNFARGSESAKPIKFAISFDAKMAGVVSTGNCRAVIAIMGVDTGSTVRWDRVELALTDSWQSFGAILDPITGKDPKGLHIAAAAGTRTLIKFAIESPSDGLGSPILVENVNVTVLKDLETDKVALPIVSTIGASITLAATVGSTGAWVNGTKTMTLSLQQYVDFQDSLVVGRSYLCVATRVSGNSANVLMEDDRIYWQAYSKSASDTSFVKDAAFTFQYDGGVFKFVQGSANSVYTINIYLVSNELSVFGTVNANTIDAGNRVTYIEGDNIQSNLIQGVGAEINYTGDNLFGTDAHRDLSLWVPSVSGMLGNRHEIGVDARPCHASIIQDRRTSAAAYIEYNITIPDDSKRYVMSMFLRKIFDKDTGAIIHPTEQEGVVTPPSRYMDVSMKLTGGSNPVGGQLVRRDVRTGAGNAGSHDYYRLGNTDFTNWWSLNFGLLNNGTGNTNVRIRIYPAANNLATSIGSTTPSKTGYCIVDWFQLEEAEASNGLPTSIAIPGIIRQVDSVTTALTDGILYDAVPTEIGDVTAGAWTFDFSNIWKFLTWIKS